jgi:hypothetical protein
MKTARHEFEKEFGLKADTSVLVKNQYIEWLENKYHALRSTPILSESEVVYRKDEEFVRQVAFMAWRGAANAFRLYPNNKHTFAEYWGSSKPLFAEFIEPIQIASAKEGEKDATRLKWLVERANKVVCELHQMDKSGDHPTFGKREVHLRVQSDLTSVNKYLVEAIDILFLKSGKEQSEEKEKQ